MDISKEIAALKLPKNSWMVVGSGLLNTLGIRKCNDIDLVISNELFDILKNQKWKVTEREDGTQRITNKQFDCMVDWYGKNIEQMLDEAIFIDNVPYMNLSSVYEWKRTLRRKKDLADLRLIDNYLLERR